MFLKRLCLITAAASISLSLGAQAAKAEESQIRVYLNGEPLPFADPPRIEDGTTLVPFRILMEKLGMTTIDWDAAASQITALKGDQKLVLQINNTTATVNGKSKLLEKAPVIINGSTFVPLRFVSETMNAEVKWDADAQLITIQSGSPAAASSASTTKEAGIPEKSKKTSYAVDTIMKFYGYENNGSGINRYSYSSLAVDRNGSAYLLEDRNIGSGYNQSLVDMIKVNTQNGNQLSQKPAEDNYSFEYTDWKGNKLKSQSNNFYPRWLIYNEWTDKLAVGGINAEASDTMLSISTRYPNSDLIGYQLNYKTTPTNEANFAIFMDQDTLLYSEMMTKTIYRLQKGKTPEPLSFNNAQQSLQLSGKKLEAVWNDQKLYVLDTGNCTLYKLDPASGDISKVYENKEFAVSGSTTHQSKFYVAKGASIYELTIDGHWSTFIAGSELNQPQPSADAAAGMHTPTYNVSAEQVGPLNNISLMAFDADENIIVFDYDYLCLRRINR
ncbi:copper amine oxidase N-terminal domain-containing protein [Paenibacillus doosanensis]|uniref:copper amine oxidase N-terminal domain-containing protein n=1 Tax=Paenibacillus doosanensis TaxID=1229154 RepID=UPI0021809ADB|nr:copper amine oxidase N-terminal domain-containing protein [Paenibacillus doosanensis]MCS7460587.1 copper amine oxidase N-terminal domain-containing protein [Paenibacillus doosanensis]